jgi:FtsP/CotA-like multicopper oxidase with cupredoxin domain
MTGIGGTASMSEMAPHANDFDQDAYLANERTLNEPDVIAVERGGRVRLRIINAAASTNFHIDTGALDATLVAVDGTDIVPVSVRRVPLAMGQRNDLQIDVPATGGAFPVLALREGARERTGVILATAGAAVQKIPVVADAAAPPLDLALESQFSAGLPLPARQADRRLAVSMTGHHGPYQWAIAIADAVADRPVEIVEGERIELVMTNESPMLHPMHLHGHAFQVVDVGNGRFAGAVRDTIQVPPGGRVIVAFDADNPGQWAFHCHHLYHLAAGMMATLGYRGSV